MSMIMVYFSFSPIAWTNLQDLGDHFLGQILVLGLELLVGILDQELVVPEFLLEGRVLLLHGLFLEERALLFELILEFLQFGFPLLDGRLVLLEGLLEILGRLLAGAGGEHDLPDIHNPVFSAAAGRGEAVKDQGPASKYPQRINPYLFINPFPLSVIIKYFQVTERERPRGLPVFPT